MTSKAQSPRLASLSQLSSLSAHQVKATVDIVVGLLIGDVDGIFVCILEGDFVGITVEVTVGYSVGMSVG